MADAPPPPRAGYAKKPVEPKRWSIEAMSSGGQRVTLGRFLTEEEAKMDLARIQEEGYYTKAKIIEDKSLPKAPDPPPVK